MLQRKLVSESVKTKQSYISLLSEKQALTKQLLQANASLESVKLRITKSEEQVKSSFTMLVTLNAIICLFLPTHQFNHGR